MKASVCSPNPDKDEEEKLILEGKLIARMEEDASQEVDCENNCLSGIKWQAEHHQKNDRRKREVLNGFLKKKTKIVTTGGRTSKVPARFLETDSESDCASTRKRVRARRDSKTTSVERTETPCSVTKRRPSKNGRIESLDDGLEKLDQRKTKDELLCSALVDGFDVLVDIQREEFTSDTSIPSTNLNAGYNLSRTLTKGLKRKFVSSHSETENSSEEIRPRKRGRPFKNPPKMETSARAKSERSLEAFSPHGDDCLTSATNATLTSPSTLKPRRKKRKLLNGLRRSKSVLHNFSTEESSGSETPTPKRRGRPPKHLSSPKTETKQRQFGSQNGVKKPWVRPVLNSLHKRALFRSPGKHLDITLTSSEEMYTKVKTKLVKVNGRTLPKGCAETFKKRRGRPPKQSPDKHGKPIHRKRKDDFVFTEEDDSEGCRKAMFKAKIAKLQKLQALRMQKQYGKKPLGAGKLKSLKNHKKTIANKLKNKSIDKAKRTLLKNGIECESSVSMAENSNVTDANQIRRRHRNNIDRVLGMRQNDKLEYEYLVQWKDGTSNWTSPEQAADYEIDLKEFLTHEYQEVPTMSRLVYQAYCHDNLDEQHVTKEPELSAADGNDDDVCSDVASDDDDDDIGFTDDEVILEEEITPKKRGRKPRDSTECKDFICKEVSVQRTEDCVHIVVRRSSGKQMRVNLRIIDSLTFAMENAAIDSVDLVVISGLGDDMFCGIDLDTIVTVPLDCEMKNYRKDVDKIRYLIQTIQHYPKPIVATISKPAQGLGAQLVALCDMVCDEASLGSPIDVALAKANGIVPYCFPRLMGHSAVSEQVLMGQPISTPTTDWKHSLSQVFDGANFTAQLSTSVKAMNNIPTISCANVYTNDRENRCSEKEEQWLEKEIQLEKERFQDSLRDLTAFWNDVTAQV